jgi:hypothetical protein
LPASPIAAIGLEPVARLHRDQRGRHDGAAAAAKLTAALAKPCCQFCTGSQNLWAVLENPICLTYHCARSRRLPRTPSPCARPIGDR